MHILRQLFSALRYLHDTKNIIHRDLKPENILVSDYDFAKNRVYIMLTDFGFACQDNDVGDVQVGTLPFQAPEIINQEQYDNKVDIWSAGCIAYYLLSGGYSYPFYSEADDDDEFRQEIQRKIREEEPDYSDLESSISPQLIELIRRCLKKNPADRPSASELIQSGVLSAAQVSLAKKTLKLEVCKNIQGLKKRSLFQRQISAFITNTIMTTQEMRECRRVFREIDQDQNGMIEIEELQNGLPLLSDLVTEITQENIQEIFNSMDQNKDGKISESEFLSACSTISEEHLTKAFKALDQKADGFIDMQEL